MDDTKKDAGLQDTAYRMKNGTCIVKKANSGMTIDAFYIPRGAIRAKFEDIPPSELFEDDGIYFLYRNADKEENKDAKVYVGKVEIRQKGGIMQRLREHDAANIAIEPYRDEWDYALVMRTCSNLNDTDKALTDVVVSQLEYIYYCKLKNIEARTNKRIALNRNTPSDKKIDVRWQESYIDYYLDLLIPTVFGNNDIEVQEEEKKKRTAEKKSAEKTSVKTVDLDGGASSIPQFTTPTDIVKQMVDMLPDSVWNPDTKFLDPACKGGEFLKELFNRLMDADSLKAKYPDKTARTLHILNEQLYGVALSKQSRAKALETLGGYGNIILVPLAGKVKNRLKTGYIEIENNEKLYDGAKTYYENCNINIQEHSYINDATKKDYLFIEIGNDFVDVMKALFKHMLGENRFNSRFGENEMKFDVVIGNPPYSEESGGGGRTARQGSTIYHRFIELGLNVADITCMVTKNNWLSSDTLSDIRNKMIAAGLVKVNNYPVYGEVFKGVSVSVCSFLIVHGYSGETEYREILSGKAENEYKLNLCGMACIPDCKELAGIMSKVKANKYFDSLVYSKMPFGIASDGKIGSTGKGAYIDMSNVRTEHYNTPILFNSGYCFMNDKDIPKNAYIRMNYKIACGQQLRHDGKVIYNIKGVDAGVITSQSFAILFDSANKAEAANVLKYIHTKFARILVRSITDEICTTSPIRFKTLPVLDFMSDADIDWSKSISEIDQQLYKKYNLTPEEIAYIEKTIKPMS